MLFVFLSEPFVFSLQSLNVCMQFVSWLLEFLQVHLKEISLFFDFIKNDKFVLKLSDFRLKSINLSLQRSSFIIKCLLIIIYLLFQLLYLLISLPYCFHKIIRLLFPICSCMVQFCFVISNGSLKFSLNVNSTLLAVVNLLVKPFIEGFHFFEILKLEVDLSDVSIFASDSMVSLMDHVFPISNSLLLSINLSSQLIVLSPKVILIVLCLLRSHDDLLRLFLNMDLQMLSSIVVLPSKNSTSGLFLLHIVDCMDLCGESDDYALKMINFNLLLGQTLN